MKNRIVASCLALVTSVSLVAPPTQAAAPVSVPGNEIQNPSFEALTSAGRGLFAPWWLDTKSGTQATLHADTSTMVSGAVSARIDIAQTNGYYWGIQLDQQAPIVAGRSYSISFWARASAPRSLPFALQQAAGPNMVYFSPAANLTTSWQQFTFQYYGTVTDPTALLHLDLGTAPGSVWLDDVVMTNLDAAGMPLPAPTPVSTAYFRGFNLKGGDQAICCGVNVFAPPATLDWAKAHGFTTFRVPFQWAALQPTVLGPLDPAYLGMMDAFIANVRARGEQVAFVPMDRRGYPVVDFVDLWTRLAAHYRDEPAIWGYDLMNEPDSTNDDAWNTLYLPAIIAAIRSIDMTHTIIVETAAGGWGQYWDSHVDGLPVQDPANNVIYETHFYFDTPANGTYPSGTAFDVPNGDLNIGVERATDFVNWCTASNVRCYAGEYGVPGGWIGGTADCTNGAPQVDPRWLIVLDRFLTYLDQNHISGTYWEAGPYGDVNDLGPTCSGQDRPQLAILQSHLGMGAVAATTPTGTATASSTSTSTATASATATSTTAATAPPADVLQNSPFQAVGTAGQGLFAPWWLEIHSGAAASLNAELGAPVAGTTAARIDMSQVNGTDWGIQLEQHIAIAANASYVISFWAKASSPRTVRLVLQQVTNPYSTYFTTTVTLATYWQPYAVQFNASAADPDTYFSLNLGAAAGSSWIDDVVMRRAGSQ